MNRERALPTLDKGTPAPAGGAVISLSSSSHAMATVPASVSVAQGADRAEFAIATHANAPSTTATINAIYGGVTRSDQLQVRGLDLASIDVQPRGLGFDEVGKGTVTLNGPAPAGGLVVWLHANSPDLQMPASVTVPAGQPSATFSVRNKIRNVWAVRITASYGASTKEILVLIQRPQRDSHGAAARGDTGWHPEFRLTA